MAVGLASEWGPGVDSNDDGGQGRREGPTRQPTRASYGPAEPSLPAQESWAAMYAKNEGEEVAECALASTRIGCSGASRKRNQTV